jgi:PhoH-like ATPase
MRVIADALGLLTEDYVSSQVVSSRDVILKVSQSFLLMMYEIDEVLRWRRPVWFYEEDALEQNIILYPNQFVMLGLKPERKENSNCKIHQLECSIKPIVKSADDTFSWGVSPRNKEQKCGLDLLMDDDIPFVSLIGRAGLVRPSWLWRLA